MLIATTTIALFFGFIAWQGVGGMVLLLALGLSVGLCFRGTRSAAATGWVLLIVFVLSWFPAINGTPQAPRRSACLNNMKQIALALLMYESEHGCFPPPYVADAQGQPLYSWRVLMLPYLERNDIYQAWRRDEPWNGPNNSKLLENLRIFNCPSKTARGGSPMTSYLAVVGPETVWPESGTVSLDSITDGSQNTLLFVEVANSGIHWAEPRDLQFAEMSMRINPPSGRGISSNHPGCAVVSFADGHQQTVPDTLTPEQLRAMLTIAGGEEVDLNKL
ncbi:MAG: DUF1559 domain-containing protein [Rhodopirellula sp.]|nr:DUF1559 domain-containing protein [Rhodopirellula sp.]